MNWQKIHLITLSVTCHSIRNFSPLIHNPSYSFVNFWNSTIDYFLSLSHSWKIECKLENNSLNNFICHLSFHKKLFPTHTQPLISICEWLNVNWKTIHSIILSVTCHSLRNFPLFIHIPSYPFVNFWDPKSHYFLFESFIKGWMWIGKQFT